MKALFGLIWLGLLSVSWTPHAGDSFCQMENKAFEAGESLSYKVYYNWNFVWLAAGRTDFTVRNQILNGEEVFHLKAVGQTLKSYDPFYKVRDYYDSYIDKQTLLPKKYVRQIYEGGYTKYNEVIYDQENKMAYSNIGKTMETTQPVEIELNSCKHDILSILYYLRNLDFDNYNDGDIIPVSIMIDNEQWDLSVTFMGREKKKVKGIGKYNTIRFRPQLISSHAFDGDEVMDVYVSDDQNRIPLLIESPLSVGQIKAVLVDYDGLKYNMDCKIK